MYRPSSSSVEPGSEAKMEILTRSSRELLKADPGRAARMQRVFRLERHAGGETVGSLAILHK